MNRLAQRGERFRPADPGDPLQMFWALASDAAAETRNPHRLYADLQQQYRSVHPGASHHEHEAAMKRLAALCGV